MTQTGTITTGNTSGLRRLGAGAAITGAVLCLGLPTVAAAPAHAQPSAVGYADATVRAFGAKNTASLNWHTTPSARAAMLRHGYAARTHWARTSADGAAGHTYVTYRNTVTGDRMTLGVLNFGHLNRPHQVDQAK